MTTKEESPEHDAYRQLLLATCRLEDRLLAMNAAVRGAHESAELFTPEYGTTTSWGSILAVRVKEYHEASIAHSLAVVKWKQLQLDKDGNDRG